MSLQHFICSKHSLAGDSCCHWPSVLLRCLSSLSFLSKLFLLLSLSWQMIFPHLSYVLFFSHHFPEPSTVRLFLHQLIPMPLCQWFLSFLPPVNRCSIAGIALDVHDSSPSFVTTDANCQKLRVFSLHRLSQQNKGFCGTLIALGTKLCFFSFPPVSGH